MSYLKVLSGLLLLLFFIPKISVEAAGTCSMTPNNNLEPGTKIRIQASGLQSNKSYTLVFLPATSGAKREYPQPVSTDATGNVDQQITLHPSYTPPAGSYDALLDLDRNSINDDCVMQGGPFTFTTPPPPTPPPAQPPATAPPGSTCSITNIKANGNIPPLQSSLRSGVGFTLSGSGFIPGGKYKLQVDHQDTGLTYTIPESNLTNEQFGQIPSINMPIGKHTITLKAEDNRDECSISGIDIKPALQGSCRAEYISIDREGKIVSGIRFNAENLTEGTVYQIGVVGYDYALAETATKYTDGVVRIVNKYFDFDNQGTFYVRATGGISSGVYHECFAGPVEITIKPSPVPAPKAPVAPPAPIIPVLSSGIPCGDATNPGFQTAIGCIHTNPVEFVKDFLKFIIAISGGLAFLMMLLGAFQMLTSAGNPDSLNAGRERLTSAVIGLLFVIFAILLMQIIGVGILDIPGFKP